jgi:hypothetical protein
MRADCRLDVLRAGAGASNALGEVSGGWSIITSGLAFVEGAALSEADQAGGVVAGVRLVAVLRRTAKLAAVTAADRVRLSGVDYGIDGAPVVARDRVTFNLMRLGVGHV